MKKLKNVSTRLSLLLVFVMFLGVIFQGRMTFAQENENDVPILELQEQMNDGETKELKKEENSETEELLILLENDSTLDAILSVRGEPQEKVETKITEFTVTKSTGEVPPDGFKLSNLLKLSISWDASYYQNELKQGDYFDVKLPDEFRFPANHSACNFDIKTPDGSAVVAKAVVTPGTKGGGNIKVTFTDYVEDRYDIKGSMYLNANFNTTIINTPGEHQIAIAIGSYSFTITVPVVPSTPQNPLNNEIFNKWVGQTLSSEGYVRWTIRINHRKGILNNVVITDQLTSENGDMTGIEYVAGNFKLEEVEMDEYGNIGKVLSTTDISDQVVLSLDKTRFTYNMGNIESKHFILRYNSTYREGLKLKNTAKLEADGESVQKKQSFF